MGLIQNIIEGRGMATVCLTVHPHISKGVGVPRGVAIRFPQGNVCGPAHDQDQQLSILANTLNAVTTIDNPNTLLRWPYRWRSRRQ